MKSPSDYMDRARECVEMAERSNNPEVKALMAELAELWINRARDARAVLAKTRETRSFHPGPPRTAAGTSAVGS